MNICLASFGALLFATSAVYGSTYYVAPTGIDTTGNGSAARPWKTLQYAITAIPDDGSTVLVRPGVYNGRIRMNRRFAKKAFLKSEIPYRAKLTAGSEALITMYGGANFELSGFEITRPAGATGLFLIQVQNVGTVAENIVIRDNILHDSYNNDLVKINNGARKIVVEGNVFYNQNGSDEHIDINGVTDVTVRDNIFFNDFAGSGRTNKNNTSSFIVIKNSASLPENKRIKVQRNVFLNWQGNAGMGFVCVGEDGKPHHEADDVTIENNLMLGTTSNAMRAPFIVKGAKNIKFRHNTISGTFPGQAFAAWLTKYNLNPINSNIAVHNNIWSSPGGAMVDFSDGEPWNTTGEVLGSNVYWNAGKLIPIDSDILSFLRDGRAILEDPKIPAPSSVVLPRWKGTAFASGRTTIRAEFLRLVDAYARPRSNSSTVDVGDPTRAPADDILGKPRGAKPEAGAYEVPSSL